MTITNLTDISLALVPWLLHDEYDQVDKLNYISATSLMKPIRQIILPNRIQKRAQARDLQSFIASALGRSLHDSIEKSWTKGYAKAFQQLGQPQNVIDRIRINPSDEEVLADSDIIAVYLEQRLYRTIDVDDATFTIGGKFDMILDGMIQDTKSTTAYTWVAGTKDDDYILQKSIYRWLDAGQPLPKIKDEQGRINFIFTDWQRSAARQNPLYPQERLAYKDYPLTSTADTEAWIVAKLRQIRKYAKADEAVIPECTPEELWQSEPRYKFYSDPTKVKGRSTRNFDTKQEADAFRAKTGKGIVVTVPGEPKRCGYCPAFEVCTQKDRYFPDDN
jgi:hypothetical protein